MYTRCDIHISVRYLAESAEVSISDAESLEHALEDGLSSKLVELFGEGVIIEYVIVRFSQPNYRHDDLVPRA